MTQEKDAKRLGLRVPKNLYIKLTDRAKYQGKTLNGLCLDMFWKYFEEKQEQLTQTKQNM